jgi:hypothetical protein
VLADELARAKRAEQVRAWNASEQALVGGLPWRLPQTPLPADVAERWSGFLKWTEAKGVRSLPAKPGTVAAWILDATDLGMSVANVLAILDAVEQAHSASGLSNPVRCSLPRLALEQIIKVDPPRSWPIQQKAEWGLLPIEIRAAITERENQRCTALRRKMNELADQRKALANGADKSAGNVETKGTELEKV